MRAYAPEPRIGEATLGGRVSVTTDSSPQGADGTVSCVSSPAEFPPDTVETQDRRTTLVHAVGVRITDDSGTPTPGMPATVTFR